MDLQSTLLQHSLQIPEARLTTLRRLFANVEETHLRLGIRFKQSNPSDVPLRFLLSECQSRQRMASAEREIVWSLEEADCEIRVDAAAVSILVIEITDYFFSLAGGVIEAKVDEAGACIRMERVGDVESLHTLPAADREVREELISIMARHGAGLEFAATGRALTLNFPLASASPSPLLKP